MSSRLGQRQGKAHACTCAIGALHSVCSCPCLAGLSCNIWMAWEWEKGVHVAIYWPAIFLVPIIVGLLEGWSLHCRNWNCSPELGQLLWGFDYCVLHYWQNTYRAYVIINGFLKENYLVAYSCVGYILWEVLLVHFILSKRVRCAGYNPWSHTLGWWLVG